MYKLLQPSLLDPMIELDLLKLQQRVGTAVQISVLLDEPYKNSPPINSFFILNVFSNNLANPNQLKHKVYVKNIC
jgi:hypothetical protein